MKTFFYLLISTIILFSCDKNDEFNVHNIQLDQFIIDNYYEDAKQLYMHEILQDSNHHNFHNPIIDDSEVENILKIIQAVYNSNSPARHAVFDEHQIHGYYCYSFNSLRLKVSTDQPEIENLVNGIIPTGDDELDKLLSTYEFDSVRTSFSYTKFPWLSIDTKNEFNLIPIESEFERLDNVLIAEFSKGCIGDGNTITLVRNNSSATITFSIGSGDCPAGCIYHKYWEFKVEDGIAKFIRTYER